MRSGGGQEPYLVHVDGAPPLGRRRVVALRDARECNRERDGEESACADRRIARPAILRKVALRVEAARLHSLHPHSRQTCSGVFYQGMYCLVDCAS